MLLTYLTLTEHAGYARDVARLAAYERALCAVVRPGDAVLDLGAGTGVLGLLALRAGARRVYVVDAGAMLEVARALHEANGTLEKAVFVQGWSRRVVLPERVDVVVSDQLGPFMTGAGLLECYADAVRRHLKPGGRLVPERLETWIAPAQVDALHEELALWSSRPAGLDMSPVRGLLPAAHHVAMPPSSVRRLGPGCALEALDLRQERPTAIARQAALQVTEPGRLDAIAAWFVAHLAPGVTMTNDPDAPDRISRFLALLPIDPAPRLDRPGPIDFGFRLDPKSGVSLWTASSGATAPERWERRHSTLDGLLVRPENLRRASPEHAPTLNAPGQAKACVYALADGRTSLATISARLVAEHPELFTSPDEALEFARDALALGEETPGTSGR